MTFRPRLLTVFGLVPTLLVAAVCLLRPASLTRLELTTYDTVLRSAPLTPPSGRVVIVDVDERSLASVGQWPWRRDLVGQLVTRLRDAGAVAVALDIIFAERDRYEGTDLSPDAALADALRPGRVFIGYGMTFEQPGSGCRSPVFSTRCHSRCFSATTAPPVHRSSRRPASSAVFPRSLKPPAHRAS